MWRTYMRASRGKVNAVLASRRIHIAALALPLLACGRIYFVPLTDADGDGDVDATTDPRAIISIAAHSTHLCILRKSGEVYCTGRNVDGQIGNGTKSPTATASFTLDGAVKLAVGEHTTFAIDADGGVWGWGLNDGNQLALPTSLSEPTPRRLTLPEPIAEIAGAQFHTCARAVSGSVYCWGIDNCGATTGGGGPNPTPFKVPVPAATTIGVHDAYSCAIDDVGTLRCWGAPYADGNGCMAATPTPTVVTMLGPVREVEGNCHLELCVRTNAGTVHCWGDYIDNNFGNGIMTDALAPTQVDTIGVSTAAAIDVGVGYSTACARTADDRIYCWGTNTTGQAGIGEPSTVTVPQPRALPFFDGTVRIDQFDFGCGQGCVRSGADIYCWGTNGDMQFGFAGPAHAPTKIILP